MKRPGNGASSRALNCLGAGMLVCLLVSCTATRDGTLGGLEHRRVTVERDRADDKARGATKAAILEALPREQGSAAIKLGSADRDAREADSDRTPATHLDLVRIYKERLQAYPNALDNDRVLYRLARTYDEMDETAQAAVTLDRLVTDYPKSVYRTEAHFRRGEIAFASREYVRAESAYGEVLRQGEPSAFYERALYMRGWSLFKLDRLDEALPVFFTVLDRKFAAQQSVTSPDKLIGFTRSDRDLLEDVFRVTSLSLAGLEGAASIPAFVTTPVRRSYEFYLYRELSELYRKQERIKDAADTLAEFVRRRPLHPQAPHFQARVISLYQQSGFAALALEAMKNHVTSYGVSSEYRRANGETAYAQVAPQVKHYLDELARHYHATAQKGKKPDDYQEAVRWYRTYLESFPDDAQAARMNFLLAELLFEQGRFGDAIREYERTAYRYSTHEKSADAGYGALLAYAREEKTATDEQVRAIRLQAADSALRFVATYPQDPRATGVLADAAEKFYALGSHDNAFRAAQRLLARPSPAAAELRRIAWTVMAHVEFDRGAFEAAERAYREALALTPESAPRHAELVERLAASLYKQGEQARDAGKTGVAAGHFQRVATLAPQASIRANADYDAAAALIALKDWSAAARLLEDFRRHYPKHPLQADVPAKLAVCYLESGELLKAAAEFETIANDKNNAPHANQALWQAAELYEKAGHDARATAVLERYVREASSPFAQVVEAYDRLAEISHRQGRQAERYKWSHELVKIENKGGAERDARTRYLGAQHMLVGAEPLEAAYRDVRLVEPLKKNLRLKRDKMQKALQAYTAVMEYEIADVASVVTYRIAELYRDFGKALLESQRPRGLSREEREQYDVLLEEQAFPFEEKAIELHEENARRVRSGLYDEWVKQSFAALSQLRPARYAKAEKSETATDSKSAAYYNESGTRLRESGKFTEAQAAYAKAISRDSKYAYAHRNLGILYDIYLPDADKAISHYRRYAELAPSEAQTVQKWIADVQQRSRADAKAD